MKKYFVIIFFLTSTFVFPENSFHAGIGYEHSTEFEDGGNRSMSVFPFILGTYGDYQAEEDMYFRLGVFLPSGESFSTSGYEAETYDIDFSTAYGMSVSLGSRTKNTTPSNISSFIGFGVFLTALKTEYFLLNIHSKYFRTSFGGNLLVDIIYNRESDKYYYGLSADMRIGAFSTYSGETNTVHESGNDFQFSLRPSIYFIMGVK